MRLVFPVALAFLLVGCGQVSGVASASPNGAPASPAPTVQSARAAEACLQSTYIRSSTLIAAYDTTAGALAAWQARLLPGLVGEHPYDWWGAYPPGIYAALCFFAAKSPGGYAEPCPAPGLGQTSPHVCADRVAVGIAKGVEMEITFGLHNRWPQASPPV